MVILCYWLLIVHKEDALFVSLYTSFACRKCAKMTFAMPVKNDYRCASLA